MKKRWQDIATLFLGFWLIVSPFILPRALGDEVIVNISMGTGVLLTAVAIAAIFRPNAWLEWIVVILASWLIASSYFFGDALPFNNSFSFTGLAESQFIVGLLVLVDASFGLFRRRAIRDMDKPKAA